MDEKKLNDDELDMVAGGMGNVNNQGNNVGNNQNIVDNSTNNNITIVDGDIIGGNKTTTDGDQC
ncbi:MAG: hypothetical protein IJ167_07990 [Lachnospiraceae bacterium]|nr:hypothetical protein [Lachnospiraceae bacterium]